MKVDEALIDRLAHLARLEFKPVEKKEIQSDLQQILNMVDKLGELDLDGVEPLVYITDEINVLREDVVGEPFNKSDILNQAPQANQDFFRVPKVLNK